MLGNDCRRKRIRTSRMIKILWKPISTSGIHHICKINTFKGEVVALKSK